MKKEVTQAYLKSRGTKKNMNGANKNGKKRSGLPKKAKP